MQRWPWLGLLVLGAAVGCEEKQPDAGAKVVELVTRAKHLEETFGRMHAALAAAEPGPCSESAIRAAIAKSQNRGVPFIDEQSLALSARGQALDPGLPFAGFVSRVLAKRRPTGSANDEKSATDAAFDALELEKQHDFVAAFKYEFSRPRADGKGFHGGELKGTLVLFDLSSGKPMCGALVFAQSHEEIAGKPGQSPQQAADKDIELESRRALEEAFAGMTRELNLDLG